MGHVLRVPFAVLPGAWPDSLALLGDDCTTIALTPAGPTALREVDPPPRWAVLLGAEGPGLSAAALGRAQLQVRIPMASDVDSLNVATAAAVAFAHLVG
jgi:tRNA G18 (ribose-2'-O)-methylase SpoU